MPVVANPDPLDLWHSLYETLHRLSKLTRDETAADGIPVPTRTAAIEQRAMVNWLGEFDASAVPLPSSTGRYQVTRSCRRFSCGRAAGWFRRWSYRVTAPAAVARARPAVGGTPPRTAAGTPRMPAPAQQPAARSSQVPPTTRPTAPRRTSAVLLSG